LKKSKLPFGQRQYMVIPTHLESRPEALQGLAGEAYAAHPGEGKRSQPFEQFNDFLR
jgi:hypothetical protein